MSNAVPAISLKSEALGNAEDYIQPTEQASKESKVIDLLAKRNERLASKLSAQEREDLILEFRMKARKLSRSILRKWHARLDLEELDSVVDLSLCEAVRRFDPDRGASFITFLYYHLRGNLIRAVSAAVAQNTIPVTEGELESRSYSEHASRLNGTSRIVNAVEVADALCNREHMLPDEVCYKKQLINLSQAACDKLDTLEQEVIRRIYLEGEALIDVATSLGYSRCHISRVKKRALEALHNELKQSTKLHDEELESSRTSKTTKERRKIHRRRPRSGKAAARLSSQKKLASAA